MNDHTTYNPTYRIGRWDPDRHLDVGGLDRLATKEPGHIHCGFYIGPQCARPT
jgi:hypothetical protein